MEAIFIIAAVFVIIYFYRNRLRRFIPNKKEKYMTIDDRFNEEKRNREKEIDQLLSKMGKNGPADLSTKDRKRLDELSKK